MLYTTTYAARQAQQIQLFASLEDVRPQENQPVHRVAVRFEEEHHRIVPLWTDPAQFDPSWTAPARVLDDRSISVRGPIPGPLFEGFGRRLLIVEDHGGTTDALHGVFARMGWDVIAVATMTDGLARLDPEPDCLVLDLVLPDGPGEAILRRVRDQKLKTRVIVYTASCDDSRLASVSKMGPDALLQKPISLADVSRIIAPCVS